MIKNLDEPTVKVSSKLDYQSEDHRYARVFEKMFEESIKSEDMIEEINKLRNDLNDPSELYGLLSQAQSLLV